MRKLFCAVLAVFGLGSVAVQATPVELSSFSKDYGLNKDLAASMANSGCKESVDNAWVIRSNRLNCTGYFETFDLTSVLAESIDSITLTISYSDTNRGPNNTGHQHHENWHMQLLNAELMPIGTSAALVRTNAIYQQTFTFNSAQALFNDILAGNALSFLFTHKGNGTQDFNLYSAQLTVFGTPLPVVNPSNPVPAPTGILLFGLGLALIGGIRNAAKTK